MVFLSQDRRRPMRVAQLASIVSVLGLFIGCDDSVAPPPSGQIESGGGGGGFQSARIGSDIPRSPQRARGASSGGGTSKPTGGHAAPTGATPPITAGIGADFYTAAAEAAPKGPAGPLVGTDDRDPAVIEKSANDYPALAIFDRSAAQSLPTPDPAAAYAPIVDPAEGELPARDEPIELATSGSEIEDVHFSSPAAGQAVLLSRIVETGKLVRNRLVRYDLASGEHPSQADLPDRAALLDVSPDGRRALVRLTFGLTPEGRPAASQTRLDVWELAEAEGRHIVGWQPGAKEAGSPSVPIGAVFLDGDRVVTLTDDGVLALWNLSESKAVYTVETGGRGPLVATPGRKYVALFTGSTFGAFETETGTFRGLLTPPRSTLAGCRDAAFSPDGKEFAAVLRRPAQSVVAWDLETGRFIHEIDAPLGLDPGLHFGSPGYLVAGGALFDLAAKKPVWLYVENPNCRNVAVSPDRRHWAITQPAFDEPSLVAVAAPSEAIAATTASAVNLASPRLGPGSALAVRLGLVDFSGDRAKFEADLGKSLARVFGERGMRFAPEADLTLVIDAEERATGETISFGSVGIGADEAVPAHEITLTLSVVDRNDKTLWTEAARIAPTALLKRQEGKPLETLLVEELWRTAPAAVAAEIERAMPTYLRDVPAESILGQTRLWAGADDVSPPGDAPAVVADPAAGGDEPSFAFQPVTMVSVTAGAVRDIAVAPALSVMLSSADDKTIRLWEPGGTRAADEVRHKAGVTKLAIHPNGVQALFGTEDGQVRIYDLSRRNLAGAYEGANGTVTAVAVTVEPTVIAGTQSGRVVRWTDADRTKPTVIADGQAAVTGVAAIPYLNRVVVTWADGSAKLVDAGTGEVVFSFDVQAGPIHGVAVSPDAQTAALATETGGAVLVSLQTGTETGRFGSGAVTAVAYRPAGLHLATANRIGRVILWNVLGGQAWGGLDGAGGQVSSIVFSGDGLRAAAAVTGRRTVPVWDLSSPSANGAAGGPAAAHGPGSHGPPAHGAPSAHGGPPSRGGIFSRPTGPPAHRAR